MKKLSFIIVILLLASQDANATDCVASSVTLDGVFTKASEVCHKDFTKTDVGQFIRAQADKCVDIIGDDEIVRILMEAYSDFDKDVEKNGKHTACSRVEATQQILANEGINI